MNFRAFVKAVVMTMAAFFLAGAALAGPKVQAENGTLTGSGMSVQTAQAGYEGTGYVCCFGTNGDQVAMTFTNVTAGSYDIRIRYSSGSGNQQNKVLVNGKLRYEQFPGTNGAWTDRTIVGVSLAAGSNTITVGKDWGWISVDYVELLPSSFTPTAGKVQAEHATVTGTGMAVETGVAGYEGNGYVCCFSNGGDQLSATFTGVAAGQYNVRVRYHWGALSVNNVVINGTIHSVQFPATSTWAYASVNNVTLPAGNTTVAITRDWGWIAIDAIELVSLSGPPPAPTITLRQPISSNATCAGCIDYLQVGNDNHAYWIDDGIWNPGSLTRGTYTGLNGTQYETQYGRLQTVGPNGEVAWRSTWKWPTGTGGDNADEVKAYPSVIFGAKPGFYNTWTAPGGHYIRLLDETLSQVYPSGATPGTFLPMAANGALPTINSSFSYKHNVTPTGRGQLTFDIWLQSTPEQTHGFDGAPITHEIMIPLQNWNYPANQSWYSHDVTLNGRLWHVHMVRNVVGPWTFVVFAPDTPFPPDQVHTLNLSAFINHLTTRVDSNGQPWANGTEHLVDIELGVEPVDGVGDIQVSNYRVWKP